MKFKGKRNILLTSSSINLTGGGISSYAIDFCNLFNTKYDIYIVSSDLIDLDLLPSVKKHYQLNSIDFSMKNVKEFLNLINEIKPDIIINSNYRLLSLAIPYINDKIIKISISHFVDGQLTIVAGYNHKYYDNIVVLSRQGKKNIEDYYSLKDSDLTKVIYNFYNTNQKVDVSYLKKKIKKKPLIITYPGGANLHKNPLLVYNIVKALQKTNLPFVFYWLGDTLLPGGRIFKKEYISELIPKDERIIFTGKIPRSEALDKITRANIFLLPSLKEGCPISLLEAISGGVIPIVSDSKHASSELIEDGVNGFVLPENKVGPYVKLIAKIANNHSAYFNVYLNSQKLYKTKLSGEIWIESMKKIFVKRNNVRISSEKFSKLLFIKDKSKLKLLLFNQRIKEIYNSIKMLIIFKSH